MGCGVPDFSVPSHSTPPTAAAPEDAKARIRTERLAARAALPAQTRDRADAALRTALVELIRERNPRTVAAYAPMPGEPGGAALPEALAAVVATLLLPVVRGGGVLEWAAYGGPDALERTRLGLLEPTGPRLGPDAVASADLVVVPAVAVDRRGVRLGRGGGFYDRALARASPGAFLVVALYDADLVDEVPAEPHDVQVPTVITPTGGVRHLAP